jgi:membrane-associated phospholipid phosphatase
VWISERIAVAYFVYLAVAAWLRPVDRTRRFGLTAACACAVAAILVTALAAPAWLREWAPLAYLLAGYYASAYLFVSPSAAIEAWLAAWDRRLLGDPSTRFAAWPRTLVASLEIIYMGCFLLIGAGFAILTAGGHRALADRYWTLVVGAEFGAFAPLAFVQTRPPWALERKPVLADRRVHDLAARMVQRFTIHVNTFPSGHVAGSLAVALAVLGAMPWTGAALLLLAAIIALACVVGRYHYIVDVVAGAVLAVFLWAIVVSFGLPHD